MFSLKENDPTPIEIFFIYRIYKEEIANFRQWFDLLRSPLYLTVDKMTIEQKFEN
jgi:hypothetical protein